MHFQEFSFIWKSCFGAVIEHLEAWFPWLTNVFSGCVLQSYRTAQQALTYQEQEEHVLPGRTALWISNPGILNWSGMITIKPARGCKRDVFPFMKQHFSTRLIKICNVSQLLKAFFNWAKTFYLGEGLFFSININQTPPVDTKWHSTFCFLHLDPCSPPPANHHAARDTAECCQKLLSPHEEHLFSTLQPCVLYPTQ